MIAKYYIVAAEVLEEVRRDPRDWCFEHDPDLDIDKAWDGLHYLLTGHSAMTMMMEGTPASLGIMGDPIESVKGGDGYLNLISPHDMSGFLAEVGDKGLDELRGAYDAEALRRSEVYIGRALADDGLEFAVDEYLYPNFEALVSLYKRVATMEGAWVMVLID